MQRNINYYDDEDDDDDDSVTSEISLYIGALYAFSIIIVGLFVALITLPNMLFKFMAGIALVIVFISMYRFHQMNWHKF